VCSAARAPSATVTCRSHSALIDAPLSSPSTRAAVANGQLVPASIATSTNPAVARPTLGRNRPS
jgi:hypothetical protein